MKQIDCNILEKSAKRKQWFLWIYFCSILRCLLWLCSCTILWYLV